MMSREELQSLNPGDRVCWGPQLPAAGWIIVNNAVGVLAGWDGGELTVWRWQDETTIQRVCAHLTLVMRGQDL